MSDEVHSMENKMANHVWVPSRLGHGEAMCARCWMTNREAAVLGKLNYCPRAETQDDQQPSAALATERKE